MIDFDALPLVAAGESKEVRYQGGGRVAIRLRPSVYSYTYNRYGLVPGSDRLRLEATALLARVLDRAGVAHAFEHFDPDAGLITAQLLLEPTPEGWRFHPDDLGNSTPPQIAPIEVVVKAAHVGTPRHRYYQTEHYPTRSGALIAAGDPYPAPIVRFDWRNPLHDAQGNRLADEPLASDMAELWINTARAADLARRAFAALSAFLGGRGLRLLDICFFIDRDGGLIFSELSPDCMRVTAADDSLDKDIWRAGGSSELLLAKWTRFVELIR
ncbi:MAG: hypothetical protein OHK0022_08070 [Roseiflexaceae bacterium]